MLSPVFPPYVSLSEPLFFESLAVISPYFCCSLPHVFQPSHSQVLKLVIPKSQGPLESLIMQMPPLLCLLSPASTCEHHCAASSLLGLVRSQRGRNWRCLWFTREELRSENHQPVLLEYIEEFSFSVLCSVLEAMAFLSIFLVAEHPLHFLKFCLATQSAYKGLPSLRRGFHPHT